MKYCSSCMVGIEAGYLQLKSEVGCLADSAVKTHHRHALQTLTEHVDFLQHAGSSHMSMLKCCFQHEALQVEMSECYHFYSACTAATSSCSQTRCITMESVPHGPPRGKLVPCICWFEVMLVCRRWLHDCAKLLLSCMRLCNLAAVQKLSQHCCTVTSRQPTYSCIRQVS